MEASDNAAEATGLSGRAAITSALSTLAGGSLAAGGGIAAGSSAASYSATTVAAVGFTGYKACK